jgi:hypothetical protein
MKFPRAEVIRNLGAVLGDHHHMLERVPPTRAFATSTASVILL